MELRTLHYFTVVAKELNITHAAQKLNMSQPPLSNQMRGLEVELGAKLFHRGKRRLVLTPEGLHLQRRAIQILNLAEKTRQELHTMKQGISGTIFLGLVEGRAPYLCARWIAGFQEEYPNVRYSLWNGGGDDVLERLYQGLADIAVIVAPYDTQRLEGFSVGREPWVAIFSRNHPLAQGEGDEILLQQLVGQALIVPSRKSRIEAIEHWFGEIGAEPRIIGEMSNYVDAVALSEQGVGVSIFPMTTYTPNDLIVAKVIIQPARQAEYVLVWNKGQLPAPLIKEFIHYVRDFLEEDKIHSQRFRVGEGEYVLPEGTQSL